MVRRQEAASVLDGRGLDHNGIRPFTAYKVCFIQTWFLCNLLVVWIGVCQLSLFIWSFETQAILFFLFLSHTSLVDNMYWCGRLITSQFPPASTDWGGWGDVISPGLPRLELMFHTWQINMGVRPYFRTDTTVHQEGIIPSPDPLISRTFFK